MEMDQLKQEIDMLRQSIQEMRDFIKSQPKEIENTEVEKTEVTI